jgi:hypothetical protein
MVCTRVVEFQAVLGSVLNLAVYCTLFGEQRSGLPLEWEPLHFSIFGENQNWPSVGTGTTAAGPFSRPVSVL